MDINDTKFSFYDNPPPPKKVYRFFENEWEAECLIKGGVWISTLQKCREYEDRERGDPNEGMYTHNVSYMAGNTGDSLTQELLRRQGIQCDDPNGFISMADNVHTMVHENSFVICTSKSNSESVKNIFGKYGVEIQDPFEFYKCLSYELFHKLKIFQGVAGEVHYINRSTWDMQPMPNRQIFLIKEDRHNYQQEYRFVWRAHKPMIQPFLLECPSISNLCKRVS